MHKVGNKIECNNMHGERIKTVQEVYSHDRGVYFVGLNELFTQFSCQHLRLPANKDSFVDSTISNVFISLAFLHSVQNEDIDAPVCLLIRIFHLPYRGMYLDARKM